MQKFTTANIQDLCGINSATLFMWERRYQLCTSNQNNNGRRYYNKEQLKNILVVACLTYIGFTLPTLAVMTEEERETLVWQHSDMDSVDALKCKLAVAVIDFEPVKGTVALKQISAKKGADEGFLKIVYPFLQTIRAGVKQKPLYAAIDPFLSLLTEAELISQIANLPLPPAQSNAVVLFGEGVGDHLLLRLINYLLLKSGQTTVYFGPKTGWQTIKPAMEGMGVGTVYVHFFEEPGPLTFDEYLEPLCQAFPDKTIVASGAAVLNAQRSFKNGLILKSDAEIVAFAKGSTLATRT